MSVFKFRDNKENLLLSLGILQLGALRKTNVTDQKLKKTCNKYISFLEFGHSNDVLNLLTQLLNTYAMRNCNRQTVLRSLISKMDLIFNKQLGKGKIKKSAKSLALQQWRLIQIILEGNDHNLKLFYQNNGESIVNRHWLALQKCKGNVALRKVRRMLSKNLQLAEESDKAAGAFDDLETEISSRHAKLVGEENESTSEVKMNYPEFICKSVENEQKGVNDELSPKSSKWEPGITESPNKVGPEVIQSEVIRKILENEQKGVNGLNLKSICKPDFLGGGSKSSSATSSPLKSLRFQSLDTSQTSDATEVSSQEVERGSFVSTVLERDIVYSTAVGRTRSRIRTKDGCEGIEQLKAINSDNREMLQEALEQTESEDQFETCLGYPDEVDAPSEKDAETHIGSSARTADCEPNKQADNMEVNEDASVIDRRNRCDPVEQNRTRRGCKGRTPRTSMQFLDSLIAQAIMRMREKECRVLLKRCAEQL